MTEPLYHEIHTSERKSFRSCRRRWDWRYREWLQPTTPIKPLEFGIAYHKAMEVLYDPKTWAWKLDVRIELAIGAFELECDRQYEAFKNSGYADYEDEVAKVDYAERRELGRGMLRYYAKQMVETDRGLTPIQVEIPFTVPVTNPKTGKQLYCKCSVCWRRFLAVQTDDYWNDRYEVWEGLPVVYRGRIDCLMMDEDGNYWVYDWKTTARLMQDRDRWLDLDDQITSYCWALMLILKLPIVGFIYHEQFKGFPQPPAKNKTVRKGCSYSVSKSQATDYQTFYDFIAEHDGLALDEGYYDDFLEWLKTEGGVFHARHKKYKTMDELRQVHENIYLEALDITDPDINIYPNPGMWNCQWCAYESPCVGKNRGDDYRYSLDSLFSKEAPYYLQASTDTRGNQ